MSGVTAASVATYATAAAAVVGAGTSIAKAHSANKAQKEQKKQASIAADAQRKQLDFAKQEAEKEQARLDEINSRADAKSPTNYRSQNAQKAKGGSSGTLLTGPTGVSRDELNLGKNVLLGG